MSEEPFGSLGTQSRHPWAVDAVAVVVPAQDESAVISRSLDSIESALQQLPASIAGSCVIVLDNCTDATADTIAVRPRRSSAPMTVLATDVSRVGAARWLGSRHALDSTIADPRHIWLAHTDADTVVPPDWLIRQVELAEQGADAVAGIVQLDDEADVELRAAFGATYELDRDGTHRHVHGANLGTRGSAYLDAGGWRPLRCGEDHDLWTRLRRTANCISSTSVIVHTSSRLAGRARHGFADDLAVLARQGETVA